MSNRMYTNDHEWVEIDGENATVGITDYAQEQLGDIVFIDIPSVGSELSAGEEACTIESVKAAGEVKAPFNGTISQVNEELESSPELVNSDAETKGWLFKAVISDKTELDHLLSQTQYDELLSTLT